MAIIDLHVHAIGNGYGGSGCWLNLGWYSKFLARLAVRQFGIPPQALRGDLEGIYLERILSMLRSSPVDKIVLLAHEAVYDHDGRAQEGKGSFFVPNDYVLGVAGRYPELLPGVAIHPLRSDAIDELERCVERGAVLLKLLPNCQNVDCSDRRSTTFWDVMARHKLPFLAHTGGELSVKVYAKRFADPSYLQLPLERGVTVIAAHCGTDSYGLDPNYLNVLIEMTRRYPNLYCDISGMQTPLRVRHFRRIMAELGDRIVQGSDLPIPVSSFWAWRWGLITRRQHQVLAKERNLFTKDIELKRAMGISEQVFSRAESLLAPRIKQVQHSVGPSR